MTYNFSYPLIFVMEKSVWKCDSYVCLIFVKFLIALDLSPDAMFTAFSPV